jgi:hypothetical protein
MVNATMRGLEHLPVELVLADDDSDLRVAQLGAIGAQ